MKFLYCTILILSFFSVFSLVAQDCSHLIDDCEYYSCVEEINHCGSDGYSLGFGLKYCNKFKKHQDKFSPEGKKWIKGVRACLTEKLDLLPEATSCSKFKKYAVKHHVPCYLESGYCQLSRKDKNRVIKIIKWSFWNPKVILTGIKVLNACRKLDNK